MCSSQLESKFIGHQVYRDSINQLIFGGIGHSEKCVCVTISCRGQTENVYE